MEGVKFAVTITNRQRAVKLDLAFIRKMAEAAKAWCGEAVKSGNEPLARLEEVEVTIVSDRRIAEVHGEFFDDPTPTDVITFQHGEILIGAETVAENGARYGHGASEEAALCVIHGLLHLAGWDDLTATEAKQMARKQEQIFNKARQMV